MQSVRNTGCSLLWSGKVQVCCWQHKLVRAQWDEQTEASAALKGYPHAWQCPHFSDVHLIFSASTLILTHLLRTEPRSQCRNVPLWRAFVQSQDYPYLTRSVFASGMHSLVWPLRSPATWMRQVLQAAAAGTLCEPGVQVCCLERGTVPSENTYWGQPEWADLCLCGLCLQTA